VARPPSLDRPTGRSRAPTPRRQVRLVADLGLLLLPALAVETFTGLLLFAFRQGLIPKGGPGAQAIFDFLAANHLLALQDISFQTGLHVWAGYLTVWALLWKAWASWPALVGWWPRRFSPGRLAAEKAAAWALLALADPTFPTGACTTCTCGSAWPCWCRSAGTSGVSSRPACASSRSSSAR
jgi:hypothetical protein